jgi:hypothetical protein
MRRRHLFDFGFPATTPTRLAGSRVLLAVANRDRVIQAASSVTAARWTSR